MKSEAVKPVKDIILMRRNGGGNQPSMQRISTLVRCLQYEAADISTLACTIYKK
jgi:hypothetical protein